jgi:hypothetical protein
LQYVDAGRGKLLDHRLQIVDVVVDQRRASASAAASDGQSPNQEPIMIPAAMSATYSRIAIS